MESREGKGIAPDLWVPAADAVNYAVAAVRTGTITTYQPLSPTTLEQPFVPEDTWARVRQGTMVRWLVIVALAAAGSVWAYFLRRKPRIVAGAGVVWLIIGSRMDSYGTARWLSDSCLPAGCAWCGVESTCCGPETPLWRRLPDRWVVGISELLCRRV